MEKYYIVIDGLVSVYTGTYDEASLLSDETVFLFSDLVNPIFLDGNIVSQSSDIISQLKINDESLQFLYQSDYKVLRHIRQKALNIETSLSEDEYLSLESERDLKSKQIKDI